MDKLMALSIAISKDMARYEKESGLTTARIQLLWELAGGATTQQQLAAAMGVSPRNVTGLVDGLVASGHVTREPHPTDRRAALVTPTDSGAATIAELQSSYADLAQGLFGHLEQRRLAEFESVLDDTIARFAKLVEDSL